MQRRRSGGGRRSGNLRADWVYRGYKWLLDDPETQEDRLSGTYYNPIVLPAGNANATAQVLYDSNDYIGSRYGTGLEDVTGSILRYATGAPARPEGSDRGPLIHGCELGIYMRVNPSSWVTTSVCYLAWRIIVAEQDPTTGRAFLDPGYSAWQNIGGIQTTEPAIWANGRGNCAEGRFFRSRRSDDTAMEAFIHRPFIPFKRRLESNEALFLYLESHANSQQIDLVNLWCRTLVTDTAKV